MHDLVAERLRPGARRSSDDPNVLLYGLQRSGTNFLERLLLDNCRCNIANDPERRSPLHKHFRLYDEKEVVPEPQYRNEITVRDFAALDAEVEEKTGKQCTAAFVISKDPWSWLLSYRRWAEKCEWPAVPHHYLTEWNLFYGRWLELGRTTPKIGFVRYLDLLTDPAGVLDWVVSGHGLPPRVRRKRVRRYGRIPQSDRFTAARRRWYLEGRYLEEFDRAELDEIDALLDGGVVEGLGYERRSRAVLG